MLEILVYLQTVVFKIGEIFSVNHGYISERLDDKREANRKVNDRLPKSRSWLPSDTQIENRNVSGTIERRAGRNSC